MLIIISGVDRVGKTTVAKEISNVFGIPYVKFSGPAKLKVGDPLLWARDTIIFHESILRLLENLYEQKCEVTAVIDRFYPDEIVYSKVIRNVDLYDAYRDIDERFANIGTKMVYVCPPDHNVLYERWKMEDKVDIRHVNSLINRFDEFNSFTKLYVYELIDSFFPNEIIDKLRRSIKVVKN